jgi:hypothetical protein
LVSKRSRVQIPPGAPLFKFDSLFLEDDFFTLHGRHPRN